VRGGGKREISSILDIGKLLSILGVNSNDEVDHPNALQLGTTPLDFSCVPLTCPSLAQRGCFVPKDSYG